MNLIAELKAEHLRLRARLRKIEQALKVLKGLSLNGIARPVKRTRISLAGRRRIAAAQRLRWARIKRTKRH